MQQVSSYTSQLIYSCPAVFTTPLIVTGLGLDDMLSIDTVENGRQEKTLDGQTVAWTVPVLVTGTITLSPGSTALAGFLQVMQANVLTGGQIPGTLKVVNIVAGFSDTFNNFCIMSAWNGHSMKERVEDIAIKFSAEIPNSTLSQLINLGLSISGLI